MAMMLPVNKNKETRYGLKDEHLNKMVIHGERREGDGKEVWTHLKEFGVVVPRIRIKISQFHFSKVNTVIVGLKDVLKLLEVGCKSVKKD